MQPDADGWNLTARRLLQRLRRPGSLESDPAGTTLRDATGTASVYDAVSVCVERALAHADPRFTTIVRRCDAGGEPIKTVARDLHLSMRHLFRFRAAIFGALAAEMRRTVESRVAVPRDALRAEAARLLARSEFVLARLALDDEYRAIALAERALERDPSLAAAWCAIASANMALALRSAQDPRTAYVRAGEAICRAEELAPRSGAVLAQRAALALWTDDEAGAVAFAEEALGSPAGAARAHHTLGWIAARRAQFEEAERQFVRATLAEPQVAAYHRCAMAAVHLRGDYERALELCRELHEIEPDQPYVLGYYVETLNAIGRFADAIAVTEAAPPEAKNFTVIAALTRAHAEAGDADTARAIARGFRGPAVSCAAIALALGETDRAWRALDRAREEPNGMLALVPYDRAFESLWDEPRLRALVG